MARQEKLHKHAPWSKKVLITLWVLQLGLSLFEFSWCLTLLMYGLFPASANPANLLSIVANAGSDAGGSQFERAAWGINMILGSILSIYIIHIIKKFASFRLTTKEFQIQSIAAILIGLLGLALFCGAQDFFDSIIIGAEVAVSIGICIYVVVIRRRVRKGVLAEMKRPTTGDVELEGGREEVPRVERRVSKDLTLFGSAPATRGASLSSARTDVELGGPPREARELV
jgi:hypothetical protein